MRREIQQINVKTTSNLIKKLNLYLGTFNDCLLDIQYGRKSYFITNNKQICSSDWYNSCKH